MKAKPFHEENNDNKIHNRVSSRMKRKSSIDINTEGSLTVKLRLIIFANPTNKGERMSQKSTEQLCVDDVVEIDELKGEGPWSNKSETLFVDLMDEEVAKGNRPTTTFTKTSWNYMRSQLIASAEYNYSHDQLKNKFNKLRQMYKDFKKILSDMTGNGWDLLLGTINLEKEQWNELFKVNES
uniref:Myb/SANT-like domain-containing protein n=1 Tax=Cucumis melo TaxID=3656 RepID=A0A9I9EA29_CUCME